MSLEKAKELFEEHIPQIDAEILFGMHNIKFQDDVKTLQFLNEIAMKRFQILGKVMAEILDVELDALEKTVKTAYDKIAKDVAATQKASEIIIPNAEKTELPADKGAETTAPQG